MHVNPGFTVSFLKVSRRFGKEAGTPTLRQGPEGVRFVGRDGQAWQYLLSFQSIRMASFL